LWAKGDREAINDPIQGGEADVYKIACVKVRKLINDKGWQNDVQDIIYMHDELVFRCRVSMLDQVVPAVQETMEFPIKGWPIKMTTDAEAGWDWGNVVKLSKFKAAVASGASLVPDVEDDDLEVTLDEAEYEDELAESRRDFGHGVH
jgi:hypothetical protein